MSAFVGRIGTFLFIYSRTIKAQTIPEAQLVAIDYPMEEELYFPTIGDHCRGNCADELNGIKVNIEAKWNKNAPETNGVSTIKLTFEHANFRENRTKVIKIPHDEKEIKEAVHICLSRRPTLSNELDRNTFTLHAVTDDIQVENAVNVRVTVEKSTLSDCYETVITKFIKIYDHSWVKVLTGTNCVTVIMCIIIIIVFILIIKKRYIPRRRDTGLRAGCGPEGGHPGGGDPGLGPPRDDSSDEGLNLTVGSDEEPSGGGLPRSGSDSSGPTGFLYYINELGKRSRQIFGQIDAEQSREAESVSLPDMSTSSGAASGAGLDEVLIKNARDDRRSGRARKRRNK